MRIQLCVLISLMALLLAGCFTPGLQKQPEPGRPLVGGQISGVPGTLLVTLHVLTPSGTEPRWGTRQGPGPWNAVLPAEAGAEYIITVEATGYVSSPTSYTVHVRGEVAYLVENGEVTSTEAVNLDFTFTPTATP